MMPGILHLTCPISNPGTFFPSSVFIRVLCGQIALAEVGMGVRQIGDLVTGSLALCGSFWKVRSNHVEVVYAHDGRVHDGIQIA
jgi:hypothetical protein